MRQGWVAGWVVGLLMLSELCPCGAQQLPPMAKDAHPSFEVATIKPSDPKNQNNGFHEEGRQISIENMTVAQMLTFAYNVQTRQIAGEPEWVDKDRWDVRGVPDTPGEPNVQQYQEMVAKLLRERFHLKLQQQTREMTVYALRVGKDGPKLQKSTSGSDVLPDSSGDGSMMRFTNCSMKDLQVNLQFMVDRPVVDQTGLAGRYNFTLRWRPEGAPANDPNAAQPLFTALPEQLGLKLDAVKAPAEVMVVEGIERPTAD